MSPFAVGASDQTAAFKVRGTPLLVRRHVGLEGRVPRADPDPHVESAVGHAPIVAIDGPLVLSLSIGPSGSNFPVLLL